MRKIARYGWKPDIPDQRDLAYKPSMMLIDEAEVLPSYPSLIDLRPQCPPLYDQGRIGSCTANAGAEDIRFVMKFTYSMDVFDPSRLFIYYNSRLLEGTVSSDAGAELRDVMKAIAKYGVCPESDWEYNDDQYRLTIKPGLHAYGDARKDLLTQYLRVAQDVSHMKACLAGGFPFIAGFSVYDSFESDTVAASGVVPMPGPDESVVGGHAVLCVGYSDADSRFICQNSWGESWGMSGFFTIPYGYFSNSDLSSDFWTIRKMEK